MKKKTVIVLAIIFLISISLGIYFSFFYTFSCETKTCFKEFQKDCDRVNYINDREEVTWYYKILGKENNKCAIDVKVLKVKGGDAENKNLNGKSMTCYLPLGDTISPGEDISLCHGILKEEIQNMIIQKAHSLILENMDEISNELEPNYLNNS
jgi:hypothetical protein